MKIESSESRAIWTVNDINGPPASAADFQNALEYLQELRIRGEYTQGSEQCSLDNVVLTAGESAFQADVLIGKVGQDALTGDGVYGNVDAQTVTRGADSVNAAEFRVRIQNDGMLDDSFTLTATAEPADDQWEIVYKYQGSAIGDIAQSAWTSPCLPPGESREITVSVKPASTVRLGNVNRIILTAKSTNAVGRMDSVRAETIMGGDLRGSVVVAPHVQKVGKMLKAVIPMIRVRPTRGFRVDFYRHRDTAPEKGKTGDNFFFVQAGSENVTKTIQFPANSVGSFTAWVQFDTYNTETEIVKSQSITSTAYFVDSLSISGTVQGLEPADIAQVIVTCPSVNPTTKIAQTGPEGVYTIIGTPSRTVCCLSSPPREGVRAYSAVCHAFR